MKHPSQQRWFTASGAARASLAGVYTVLYGRSRVGDDPSPAGATRLPPARLHALHYCTMLNKLLNGGTILGQLRAT